MNDEHHARVRIRFDDDGSEVEGFVHREERVGRQRDVPLQLAA